MPVKAMVIIFRHILQVVESPYRQEVVEVPLRTI